MKLIHYKILTVILTILLVGSVVLLIQNIGSTSIKKISADEAGKKVLAYIDANILKGQGTSTLVSINEDKNKGLYKLELSIKDQAFESYITLDGNILFPDSINLGTNTPTTGENSTNLPAGETVDGDFIKVANPEILKEDGKPVIYFFGSTSCPYCVWEHPLIQEVAAKFGDKIVFYDIMADKIPDEHKAIFSKYSDGSIPTIVLGGRFYRIGSGEQIGKDKEIEVLTKLIQELL